MSEKLLIALAGNPNSGKTTIFNSLTGARQHVGNYPGVTVEKKEGRCIYDGITMHIVDLPGTYSLTANTLDEVVARDFILNERPDVVIDVVDASNLERNLYLSVQLMELGARVVLDLNMSDVASARGFQVDLDRLSRLIGVKVVSTVGHKEKGMEGLKAVVIEAAQSDEEVRFHVNYGREIEEEIGKLERLIEAAPGLTEKYFPRWLAIKLIENDADVTDKVQRAAADPDPILTAAGKSMAHLQTIFGEYPEIVIAERRYGFISGACQEAVRITAEIRHTTSDRIDMVLTNRLLGLPIFLVMMYFVFKLTFTVGDPPMGWIESFFGWLGGVITRCWPRGSESALKSLLVDGIIGGVGGVIVFLPNILLLFFTISLLEDSGYMARAAFIMDQFMHRIRLHGKSFIPMLIGFGCSVPAIMATRTIETRRDRLTTILIIPLMSCGARLPIYALIIPAFFPQAWHGRMLWLIYVIGILVAVACARVLRSTLFRGETTPLVMELPPYRIPTIKGVLIHMWTRAWLYLRKAGTIILGVSIVLWAMTSYPRKTRFDRDYGAMKAEARARFLSGVKGLNGDLGLPADSGLLLKAAEADLAMAAEQEKYFENQPGFKRAEENHDATIKKLTKSPNGDVLARFLRMQNIVERAHGVFDRTVREGNLRGHSAHHAALEITRHYALGRTKETDSGLYAAAIKYREDVEQPYHNTLARIENGMRAEELAYSVAGRIGRRLACVLKPLGFDWKIGTALVGAFAAKEVFVAQMGIVYAVGEADEGSETLRRQLRQNYTPLVGFCIMIFCLISAPCIATIAVTRSETGAWRWALLQLGGLTLLAYVITLVVYQTGVLLGLGVG
ncbi:MAG: ferrous iron transport protein B [Planctomycetes bacterium]|nr:ferrous iron transport protein B [Planctomycetota bacterium]